MMERGRTWLSADDYTVARRANFKGNTSVKPVDPQREAEAQIMLQRELAALQEEQRVAAEAREAAALEERRGQFSGQLEQLFNTSLSSGQQQLQRQGLDLERFDPLLRDRLTQTRQRVPDLASDPGSFFDIESIISDLVSDETNLERRNLNLALNEFAAPGFAQSRVPNTLDDPILSAILSEQFTDASTQLNRARDRGNLTDFGFNTALSQLETQRGAADSRLQGLGGGVLEDFRTGLRDIAGQGRARADAFQFGDTFDPASVRSNIDTLFGERSGRLEGDIRGALGGESLFNIGDILGRASSAQGAQNQTAVSPSLLTALSRREEDRAKNRGIGSQGVF